MFRKNLEERLRRIFEIKKITFLAPDAEAPEQDCLFVEISTVAPRLSAKDGGLETAKVSGFLVIFSQGNRLPYGFFAKRVEQSSVEDTGAFFFSSEIDVPNSPARYQNIHERRVPFTFLYEAQYDPDRGSLTSIDTELTMGE